MNGYLLEDEAFGAAELFEQVIVALAAFAEAVVVADDDGVRMKFGQEEVLYVLLRRKPGKGFGEGDDDEVVYLLPGQQLDLFFEGIDQADVFGAAFDYFP